MGKSAPKPKKLQAVAPSPQEQALNQLQIQAAQNLMSQSGTTLQNSAADRNAATNLMQQVQNPAPLNQAQQTVVSQLQQAYLKQYQDAITSGLNQNIFNQNLNDSLSSLAARGVLNSTFGSNTLANLYGQRASLLAQAGDEAATQGLNLSANMMQQANSNNLNLFNTMYQGSIQGNQLGGNQLAQTVQSSQTPNQNLQAIRLNQQGIDNANISAMNNYNQSNWQNKNSLISNGLGTYGSIGGAVIGGALGSVVPGLGTAVGASIGGSLGGMAGKSMGGFF